MVSIKGSRNGVLIALEGAPDQPFSASLRELEAKLKVNPAFFHGSEVVVDVKGAALDEEDLNRIAATLAHYGIRLESLAAQHEDTMRAARALGIPLYDPTANKLSPTRRRARSTALDAVDLVSALAEIESAAISEQEGLSEGILINRRVRSGQVIKHPGHIVVIGDVNPGASLVAGGDIVVWGRLQGNVHAGALGDDQAVVCALEFVPAVVRIAELTLWEPQRFTPTGRETRLKWLGALLGSFEAAAGKPNIPAMARIVDQEIVVSPWVVGR